MPDPLMLARACRYVDGQLLARQPVVRSKADSGLLAPLQEAIAPDNVATGGSSPQCGDPPTTSRPTLDVLRVVGPTGSYGTISIERDRCTVAAWLGTYVPPRVPFRTIAVIDGVLGPPN